MAYYKDLREYVETLEKNNLLWRIKSQVKKETELIPLVRWQFRGLTEDQRRAFLFENVTDQKGTKYDGSVLAGALAGSTRIYALGLKCRPEEIGDKWDKAILNPIAPKLVKEGPCQEEVHTGDELDKLGLEEFPCPVNTPGFGGALRTTSTHFFSKDPETGIRNIGNYGGFFHARNRMKIGLGPTQHLHTHLLKARERGLASLPAALVVSAVPAICYVSVARVPYEADELAIAGGLAGKPIEVVRCKTVDIEVPATAEIVIEGNISTEVVERGTGGFGEYSGYMAGILVGPVFNISCITHRKRPIFMSIVAQFPPSEESKITQIASERSFYTFLKHDCNIPGLLDVAFHEACGSMAYCVIKLKKYRNAEVWQALNLAVGYTANVGKIIIAVDEDIDPRDPDSVNWALSYRVQPHRDTRITMGRVASLDPSSAPSGSPMSEAYYPSPVGASALLIDATCKWPYPPVALPKREYMERAREIWEAEGLPRLKPRVPWFGYELGYWPEEYREAAEINVRGEILKLGEKKGKEQEAFHLP